jgi:hypothetical protein
MAAAATIAAGRIAATRLDGAAGASGAASTRAEADAPTATTAAAEYSYKVLVAPMTAGWSCRGAAGTASATIRRRAALAAIGKRGRYCEMDECAGESQSRHPGAHDGRARQRCLD